MYSFGRDFDEGLEIDNIFREYIEQKNNKGFLDRAEALSGDNLDVQKRVFEAVSLKLMPFAEACCRPLVTEAPSPIARSPLILVSKSAFTTTLLE